MFKIKKNYIEYALEQKEDNYSTAENNEKAAALMEVSAKVIKLSA